MIQRGAYKTSERTLTKEVPENDKKLSSILKELVASILPYEHKA